MPELPKSQTRREHHGFLWGVNTKVVVDEATSSPRSRFELSFADFDEREIEVYLLTEDEAAKIAEALVQKPKAAEGSAQKRGEGSVRRRFRRSSAD